ncbi:MAG: DUF1559 family PulG-like putative transporter [Pirellulales bacterium]
MKARSLASQNNLKQIVFACHIYYETYQQFPPAYLANETGKPVHSWRVLILPYLGEEELYRQYRFDEPWDSEANVRVLIKMPSVFHNPSFTKSKKKLFRVLSIRWS